MSAEPAASAAPRGADFYRALVKHTAHFISVADSGGRIRYASPAAMQIFGYEPDEILGRQFMDYVHPDDAARMADQFAELLTGPIPPVELRVRHRDGSWRHIEAVVTNLLDDPDVRGVVVHSRDITERVEAECALAEREEELRAIMSSLHNTGVAVYDRDGTWLKHWGNPELDERFGIAAREVVGKSIGTLLQREQAEQLQSLVEEVFASGESQRAEQEIDLPGGRFWYDISLSPLRAPDGQVRAVLAAFHEITDRKQTEQALREAERLYFDLYENAPELFASLDAATGAVRRCNRKFCETLGYSRREILGRSLFDIVDPATIDAAREAFERFREFGRIRDVRLQMRRRDGSALAVILSASAVRDEQGNIIHGRAILHNASRLG